MFGSKKKYPEIDWDHVRSLAENPWPTQPPVINISMPPLQILRENELRPCYIYGRKAIFHRWANDARPQLPQGEKPGENARYYQFRSTKAIVEFEDGTVGRVWPNEVKFADGGQFQDYTWLPLEQEGTSYAND